MFFCCVGLEYKSKSMAASFPSIGSAGLKVSALKLSRPFDIPNSQLAILPSAKVEAKLAATRTCAEVAGWGDLEAGLGQGSEFLMSVNVQKLESNVCERAYDGYRVAHGYGLEHPYNKEREFL